MLKLLFDENMNNDILRGLRRRHPEIDVVRAQDIPALLGAEDPIVLEWAAQEGRVLLTHDVQTMTHYAYERVEAGLPMPGVFEINSKNPVGQTIEDILLVVFCSFEGEWEGQIRYLPLR